MRVEKRINQRPTTIVTTTMGNGDNWETPPAAFALLAQHVVVPGAVIWDPFFSTGRVAPALQAAFPQHTIIHERRNFFEWAPPCSAVVSNPPYSIKQKIIERLVRLNVPFALLIQSETLFTGYMQRLLATENMSVLVPKQRTQFIDPASGETIHQIRFHAVWVIRGMQYRTDAPTTRVNIHLT